MLSTLVFLSMSLPLSLNLPPLRGLHLLCTPIAMHLCGLAVTATAITFAVLWIALTSPPPPRAFSLPFAFSRQRPSRKAGDDVQYLSAVLATRPVPVLATISVLVLATLYSGNSSGDCSVDTKSL